MPPRVYQYGLSRPEDPAPVRQQMVMAHRYRNTLIEIERDRRMLVRDVLATHPMVEPVQRELDAAAAAHESAKQDILTVRAARRGIKESRAQTAELKAATARLREIYARVKAAKKAACDQPEVRARFDAIAAQAKERAKAARAACGVYWGTYLLVEAAVDSARRSKDLPRFRRQEPGGQIGVQIQNGMTVDKLFGDNRLACISPVDPRAWDPGTRRGDRRRASRTQLRMRIGSEGRNPIWASFQMIMHRPLPADAIVKAITVRATPKNLTQMSWFVDILVDVPEASVQRLRPDAGRVALNLGFCTRPGGSLRVGYLVGDDGFEREILVPFDRTSMTGSDDDLPNTAGVIDRMNKSSDIASIRSKRTDEMRGHLWEWITGHRDRDQTLHESVTTQICRVRPEHDDTISESFTRLGMYIELARKTGMLPGWLRERTRSLHAWKSPNSFHALARFWRHHRFKGDDAGYEMLESWRYRDDHLDRYQSGLARRARLHRREIFRTIADKIASRYRTLIIDDTNLTHLVRSTDLGGNHDGDRTINVQQRTAGGSLLREAFVNAFGSENTVKLSAVNVTASCHACQHQNDIPDDSGRDYTCAGCGITWDQDANACRNLLARERQGDASEREAARAAKALSRKPYRSARLMEAKQKRAS